MTEGKEARKKKKSGTPWVVVSVQGVGRSWIVLYSGPDKNRAREEAAEAVSEKDADIRVFRAARMVKLSAASLRAELPKDAF